MCVSQFNIIMTFRQLFLFALIGCAPAWAQTYVISTYAGDGISGFSGDGGSAASAQLNLPGGIAMDSSGNLYIADSLNNRVRKISNGTITTVAGNGTAGFSGDNGPAASAELNDPLGVAVDASGNLYIADAGNNVVRMVSTAGTITTFAGQSSSIGYGGDGGAANVASLSGPTAVAADSSGNVYIADANNDVIRVVNGGNINSVPGTLGVVSQPDGLAVDKAGNLYIADTGNEQILKYSAGAVSIFAGNGSAGFSGDDGPAINAEFYDPMGIATDSSGYVYVADTFNSRIRKIAPDGTITTIAGTGYPGYGGDGGPAALAVLYFPHALLVDPNGNVYISDTHSYAIRLLKPLTPAITPSGVVDAASFTPQVSPGALATVFGSYFSGVAASAQVPLPTSFGGVTVTVNDTPAPILYVGPSQINFQIPWATSTGNATVVVSVNGLASASMSVPVVSASPAVYIVNGGAPAVQNSNFTLNGASNPAKTGDNILVYLDGSGAVSPAVPDGAASPQAPLANVTAPFSAVIANKPATVTFAGLAPGFVGLVQMNITIPTGLSTGSYPLLITIDGQTSKPVNISVGQ